MLSATGRVAPPLSPVLVFVYCLSFLLQPLPHLCPPVEGLPSARPLTLWSIRRPKFNLLGWIWKRAPPRRVLLQDLFSRGLTTRPPCNLNDWRPEELDLGSAAVQRLGLRFLAGTPCAHLPLCRSPTGVAGLHPPSLHHGDKHDEPSRLPQPSRAVQFLTDPVHNHRPSRAKAMNCVPNRGLLCTIHKWDPGLVAIYMLDEVVSIIQRWIVFASLLESRVMCRGKLKYVEEIQEFVLITVDEGLRPFVRLQE